MVAILKKHVNNPTVSSCIIWPLLFFGLTIFGKIILIIINYSKVETLKEIAYEEEGIEEDPGIHSNVHHGLRYGVYATWSGICRDYIHMDSA